MEFRCENDQDKARNERKVLKQLGVKLVNPGKIGQCRPSLVILVSPFAGTNLLYPGAVRNLTD